MIKGKYDTWDGIFGLFTPDEIEVWDTPDAINDLNALAMLDEKAWVQEDVCLGDWVVDCISYDTNVVPDMLIIARRPSGMGVVFLLKCSSREGKTGYLMRTRVPECVEQSIFTKYNDGKKINCQLVLAERLDPLKKIVHLPPFTLDQVEIDGSDIVVFTVPRSKDRKSA